MSRRMCDEDSLRAFGARPHPNPSSGPPQPA
jgi:hypothetical protein